VSIDSLWASALNVAGDAHMRVTIETEKGNEVDHIYSVRDDSAVHVRISIAVLLAACGTSTRPANTTFKSLPTASMTEGSIQGIVKAFNTDAPIDGVTVIATSPALAGGLKGITDGKGFYKIAPLPPGEYLVTFYYDDMTAERSHILINADMATPVFQILRVGSDDPVVHHDDGAATIEPIPSARPLPPVCIYLHTCGTWN
jgi:hypothetical protein